jgi:hypothetical protein
MWVLTNWRNATKWQSTSFISFAFHRVNEFLGFFFNSAPHQQRERNVNSIYKKTLGSSLCQIPVVCRLLPSLYNAVIAAFISQLVVERSRRSLWLTLLCCCPNPFDLSRRFSTICWLTWDIIKFSRLEHQTRKRRQDLRNYYSGRKSQHQQLTGLREFMA